MTDSVIPGMSFFNIRIISAMRVRTSSSAADMDPVVSNEMVTCVVAIVGESC